MTVIKRVNFEGRTYFNVPLSGELVNPETKGVTKLPIPSAVLKQKFLEQQWQEVKTKRQKLLNASDWTQAVDTPLSELQKTAWQTYRQALRDLPEKFESPESVVWPVAPNA